MVTSNANASPALIPMGHFGSVDDVASVAVMLAMNGYVTGQTLSVNGGWYMTQARFRKAGRLSETHRHLWAMGCHHRGIYNGRVSM